MDNGHKVMKAAIYARCSTDENRQDVATQLSELRRYCEAFGWAVRLVYAKEYRYYKRALNAERHLKKLTRKAKEELVRIYAQRCGMAGPADFSSHAGTRNQSRRPIHTSGA